MPPPGRPIVSTVSSHTEKMSQFVDHFLNACAQNVTSYNQKLKVPQNTKKMHVKLFVGVEWIENKLLQSNLDPTYSAIMKFSTLQSFFQRCKVLFVM